MRILNRGGVNLELSASKLTDDPLYTRAIWKRLLQSFFNDPIAFQYTKCELGKQEQIYWLKKVFTNIEKGSSRKSQNVILYLTKSGHQQMIFVWRTIDLDVTGRWILIYLYVAHSLRVCIISYHLWNEDLKINLISKL